MEDKSIVQNDKVGVKGRRISRLAIGLTIGAATWLWFTYYVLLDIPELYDAVTTFPIWFAGITATLGLVLSIAKIATSFTWKGRLIGTLFILINLTVIAMSAFSIALSYVNFMGYKAKRL